MDLDWFGTGFNFKLPKGKDTYNSYLGSFFSLCLIITIFLYGTMQVMRLQLFEETIVTMSVKEDFFSALNDTISSEDYDLNFAFGIISYGSGIKPNADTD